MSDVLLEARGLTKVFRRDLTEVHALRGVDLVVRQGERVAVLGASGAGKSTLLHILGALERPTSGTLLYRGSPVFDLGEEGLARFRNREIGFVFQFHHLLPEFNALENVMMPALIQGVPRTEARERAREMLTEVGLEHRVEHRPGELSGGEQQRVAVARALVMRPALLLADEPTGNLDSTTGEMVMDLMMRLNEAMGITLIVVTHNEALARKFPRRLKMADGRIVAEEG
ncbi:MAG TPA: ABC transporter ATP-binding protein [Deltaproteobacteria bacterium]|nr:ABC transporter ATP-binding protein [Deltaproteobacteria bacterium]